jgi:DNA-binding transcriptional LysR family regulator
MNVRFLETFLWVARLRSFSLAAEKLNSTQTAVSHRIAALERELGVRLLDRCTREVKLTAAGADALAQAERIVKLTAQFRRQVSDPASIARTLRVGVIDSVSFSWLPSLIDRLSQLYPEVVLELEAGTSVEIAASLRHNDIDLALMMGPLDGAGVVCVDLCALKCIWVASPSLGIGRETISIGELAEFPILSFPRGSRPHAAMTNLLTPQLGSTARMHTANLATMIRLAIDGFGIAAVPAGTIQRELTAGFLVEIDVAETFPPIPLHACYLESSRRLPALVAELASEAAAAYCRLPDGLAWPLNVPPLMV